MVFPRYSDQEKILKVVAIPARLRSSLIHVREVSRPPAPLELNVHHSSRDLKSLFLRMWGLSTGGTAAVRHLLLLH